MHDQEPQETVPSPVKTVGLMPRVHRHMWGRYRSAILMGLTFGLLGSIYGYVSTKPSYRSNGILRITPLTLRILYAQADVAPSIFDSFVDVQVNIMRSRPVIESILNSQDWRDALNGRGSPEAEIFLRSLEITHPNHSEIINISYTDSSPETAVAGVRLLIESYLNIQGDRSGNSRIGALEKRSEQLTKELNQLRTRMSEIGHKYGTDDLKQLHQTKITELARLETMIKDTEINLILAEAAMGKGDDFKRMPAEEIASTDEMMRRLVDEKQRCQLELTNERRGEDHPEVIALESRLAKIQSNIEQRAEAFRKFPRSSFVNNVGVIEGVPTTGAVDALKFRMNKLRELFESSLEKSLEIGRQALLASNLQEEVKATKDRLTENQTKLEQVRVDSSIVGQINVISYGELPPGPIKDKRRTMAMGGFAGGFGFGFGIIVVVGLVDRRLRRASDLRALAIDAPLLGVLPEMPMPAFQTAYCIRQIVTALQADPALHATRVFAVTSAQGAEGKTMLTAALAVSLAALGKRTLLIDCDTTGKGFSEPLAAVKPSGKGLANLLNGEPLQKSVTNTSLATLDLLTTGDIRDVHACGISSEKIRRLFTEAASQYDRVLIDTATLPRCLETILVCKEAESVLLVVRRDSLDPELLSVARKLREVGACVGGIIFNDATAQEMPTMPSSILAEDVPQSAEWVPLGIVAASVAAITIARTKPASDLLRKEGVDSISPMTVDATDTRVGIEHSRREMV